jgi:ubiquinone/menaquinone biosynthesis C-methylase UbiE
MTNKDTKFDLKKMIKHRVIGTQYEWESHIENMFYIFDKYLDLFAPDTILDVGCGNGDRTIKVANYFNVHMSNVYGLDYNDNFVMSCKKTFNASKIDLETDDIPHEKKSFDLVICNQVLEHLKNYRKVINDLIRVTRKRGYIVIGIPNLAHLINRIYLMFGIQPMCIHLDGSHVRGFTHKGFVRILNSFHEVKLIDSTGALIYPLPLIITKFISHYFVGLSGYVCYLLQKVQ